MSVIAFYELDQAGKGMKIDDQAQRTYSRIYNATCSSRSDSEVDVQLHPKCPKAGVTILTADGLARCTGVSIDYRPKTRWKYTVKADFSTSQDEPPKRDNPLEDDAEIEVASETVMVEKVTDPDGNPYTNTAGDLITVKTPTLQVKIQIQKNISIFSGWITKIRGVYNDRPIRIKGELWPAQTLTVTRIKIGKTLYRNKIAYMVADIELAYDEDGWVKPVLNTGFNELLPDPSGKKTKNGKPILLPQRCKNEMGEYVQQPVFLDAKGRRPTEKYEENGIIKLRPKPVLDPRDIVVLNLKQMRPFDFSKLPLA